MTIRGTSNQSISSMTRSVKNNGYELCGTPPAGGAGESQAGAAEYREVDNSTAPLGILFVPSGEHLKDATPQVQQVPGP